MGMKINYGNRTFHLIPIDILYLRMYNNFNLIITNRGLEC
jgi:hypothetical protein